MPFRNIRDYYNYVTNLVARKNLQSEVHKIRLRPYTKSRATIRADEITFADGGALRFSETVFINDRREVIYEHYSYQFRHNDDSFFRYDKDSQRKQPYIHAECHLHVDAEEPRYITHETSFEEVLEFIWACFYGDA